MKTAVFATNPDSRRDFLRRGAAAAIVLPAIVSNLAACADTRAAAVASPPDSLPAVDPAVAQRAKADAMDAMHEKGVKAFPAKTEGKGNQPFQPRIEKGVKVYDLTCEEIQWEVGPGRKVKAWAYNGQVPGPRSACGKGIAFTVPTWTT